MKKSFASTDDLDERKPRFTELDKGVYAFTADGDPNSGVIIGDDFILIVEAQATPRIANKLIKEIRAISDKPIKYLVLTHYHAVRVLGASAYNASEIIMSDKTLEMVRERGAQDWLSEFERFPRLFKGHEAISGLTWPTISFSNKISVELGNRRVEIMHLGEGHTRGDAVVWLPKEKILFAGDLVENGATPYCGDAQLKNWPATLDKLSNLSPHQLIPGRGDALINNEEAISSIVSTKEFVTTLFTMTKKSVENGESLNQCYKKLMSEMKPNFGHWFIFEHCMCFNVSRAYDEAQGISHPKIWTKQRDIEMWNLLNQD